MFENGFPKGWSTLRKLAWLYRTVINAVSSVLKTVTGNPIHILDALAKPAQALSVKLEPIQDLHGYDNPWPAGGGSNIWDEEWEEGIYNANGEKQGGESIRSKNRIPCMPSTSYYIAYPTNVYTTGLIFRQLDVDGNVVTTSIVNTNNFILTTRSDCVNLLMCSYAADEVTTYNHDIAINYPSTVTTYSPYSNICPISGHTDADVTRTGKNLANMFNDGKVPSVSNGQLVTANGFRSDFIPFKANAAFTFHVTGAVVYVMCYDKDKNFLSAFSNNTGTISNTTPANTAYVMLRKDNNTAPTDAQLEYGTITDYSPYDGTTYPIPLGQTVYGGTLDVLTGVLTVDRAEVTLPLGNPYIIGTYSDRKDCGWNFPQKAPGLTNVWSQAFKTESANAVPPIYCVAGRGANTYVTFGVPLAEADDAQSAGDYIRSLSPSIVIELATPITIQLTPQQVELLLGENNILSDGTMTLVYLADGNASDEEALNILLGGRYVNNHEADEPTDREALDILLGGTR